MRLVVLGSAAGGGFPQWNCNCPNCRGVRSGLIKAKPRMQSSLAITVDGSAWLLLNASPDLRFQAEAFLPLHQQGAIRSTSLNTVLLADSQIDHTAGLLFLRESRVPLTIFCTERVYSDLTTGFPVLKMLESYCGLKINILRTDGEAFTIPGFEQLALAAIPVAGKGPPYARSHPASSTGDGGNNVAFVIKDRVSGKSAVYAPGFSCIEGRLADAFASADALLVDGTFFTDDEMERAGCGTKRASAMGHQPLSGDDGLLKALSSYPQARRVLVHINNTNPILDESSPERAFVVGQGIEIAEDGLTLEL